MGRRTDVDERKRRRRPATSPDEREQQLAGLAYDLAEEQILAGTASSQVITHFLKAGSTRELLERQKIQHENALSEAKKEAMEQAGKMEELYANAIKAMSMYQGNDPPEEDAE